MWDPLQTGALDQVKVGKFNLLKRYLYINELVVGGDY